jgi:chemotaxis protein MotB
MRHRHEASEHAGESYFASISDLMVGILFVFLLMLTIFALNYRDAEQDQLIERQKYEQLRVQLEQQQRETERQKAEAERQRREAQAEQEKNRQLRVLLRDALDRLEYDIQQREQARQTLLTKLAEQLRARGVQVVVDQHSGVLRLSGDLLFATGSAALSPEAAKTVGILADVMMRILPCYAGSPPSTGCPDDSMPVLETVLIEGHTDHRPFMETFRYRDNEQLSTERALAVFSELRRAQPGLDAVRNSDGLQLLGASGYGDRRPLPDAQGNSEEDFHRNRRIDIRFVLTSRTSEEMQRLRDQIRRAIAQ